MEENNKLKMIKTILNNMKEDHIGESAAQCAYYVILSFIPFTILLLTLIQYTNVEPQQLFDIISNIIPFYGSLTALMLIMMWIYTCFYIIFF